VEMGESQYVGKKSIDHAMTVMPDGNNRIQVVTMNCSHKNCCIVNVYMPSEAKEGDYEYKDNLDQLQEIIQKYDGKRLAALDGCLVVLTHFHV
jgi:hypothetical protein